MSKRGETMAIVRQKIINAGSDGYPCRELAASLGITWNTLKTVIYKLGKAGFEVAYRCRGGVPLYFMQQLAPASTGEGGHRPKSTRITCEQDIMRKVAKAPAEGLTYDQVRGKWSKSSIAVALQNLRESGKLAIGKWATGKGQSTGRIFASEELRDAARRAEDEQRAAEKRARRAEVAKAEANRHAARRRAAMERRIEKADAAARRGKRERLANQERAGRPIPTRAEPAAAGPRGPVIKPPGLKVQVIKSPEDTRFKVDPREASMLFSALGPGQYMRVDNAIARAYGSGK